MRSNILKALFVHKSVLSKPLYVHTISELDNIDAPRDTSCMQWENAPNSETKLLLCFLIPYASLFTGFYYLYISWKSAENPGPPTTSWKLLL